MVGGQRAEVGSELCATAVAQLVGVQFNRKAQFCRFAE